LAQTQSSTTEGYTEIGKIMAGEASTVPTKIVLIKTSCTADATQTYAGITKCTEDGLAIAAGTCTSETTTVTDDTVQVTHQFTTGAGVSVTVLGAGLVNTDGDVLFMLTCFNAGIALEAGDTLTPTLKMQFKAD
jgi:hypothetical protein